LLKIVSLEENNEAIERLALIGQAAAAEPDPPWDWHGARSRCLREASRLLRNPEDAEEAVQEALTRAWRRRRACASPEEPMGWMLAITRNEALRLMERRARRTSLEVVTEHAPEGDAVEPMESAIAGLAAAELLGALNAEERMLVTLRYRHDLSQAEVARRMGLPEGTVKVRLHRLHKRLRESLERDDLADFCHF
jgi:RNA polymerase sigma-70 factor (ECF subfamily)